MNQSIHKCDTCTNTFPQCDGEDLTFASETDDTVIKCDAYSPSEETGSDSSPSNEEPMQSPAITAVDVVEVLRMSLKAVLSLSAAAAISKPGQITPPRKTPFSSTRSMVKAVPKSAMTTASSTTAYAAAAAIILSVPTFSGSSICGAHSSGNDRLAMGCAR